MALACSYLLCDAPTALGLWACDDDDVHVHNRIFCMDMRELSTTSMQHAHLSKRHAGRLVEVFPCLSCVDRKKKKKIDRIAYSDASVIVIKSRKSKGYDIADTDCTWGPLSESHWSDRLR